MVSVGQEHFSWMGPAQVLSWPCQAVSWGCGPWELEDALPSSLTWVAASVPHWLLTTTSVPPGPFHRLAECPFSIAEWKRAPGMKPGSCQNPISEVTGYHFCSVLFFYSGSESLNAAYTLRKRMKQEHEHQEVRLIRGHLEDASLCIMHTRAHTHTKNPHPYRYTYRSSNTVGQLNIRFV